MQQTDTRFPIFVFSGSVKDSHATGGGVPRSMRYGWVQGRVGLEFPATQFENKPESTCQPKWQLAANDNSPKVAC